MEASNKMTNTRKLRRLGNRDAILAILAANHIDRREFLKRVGAGGVLMLGGPALLAACGGGGGDAGNSLFVDSWIEYIDLDDSGNSPTIARFEEQTGIDVTYTEGVNTNEDWFGKYQPQLAAGQPLGIDLVVLTDYMAARMIRLGFVETIDKANVPNISNLAPALATPGFDPNRDYTLPWQSGFDVLGYDIEQTGRELTSWADLMDPAFAGKVGLLEAYIDSIPPFLLLEGKSPADASVDDYVAATEPIREIVDSGQVRQIYGNDYLDALLTGDLAVSIAYSGDIVANQADAPQLRYVLPQEGYILWTDNMLIPKGAANKAGAEAWMNFYYEPVNAAELAAFIWYVSPVVGSREAVAQFDETLVDEPLIFPDEAILSNSHIVRSFTEEEEAVVNEALAAAIGV